MWELFFSLIMVMIYSRTFDCRLLYIISLISFTNSFICPRVNVVMCSKLKSIYPMLFFGSETKQKGCFRTMGIMLAILQKVRWKIDGR